MMPVVMTWEAASTFGWGILGLNIFFHWANDPDIAPLMVYNINKDNLVMIDPMRMSRINYAINRSNEFAQIISQVPLEKTVELNVTVIHGIGNGLEPTRFRGTTNIGRLIFEDTRFVDFSSKIDPYDVLLVASNWAKDIVESHTDKPVHIIHEGIDPSLFFPGPKSGILDPNRFYVFSGGKIEYRKAHDLVMAAFRIFGKQHPDAVLITSWHSPFPQISKGFKGILDHPLQLTANGQINAIQWAIDNGIAPEQFFDIGPIPNQLMPQVLREMDVSLQPSRAEACSNLPVMEAMACGIPVILSNNTGHKDLVESSERNASEHCISLNEQRTVDSYLDWGTDGWGESSVDEIVSCLEYIYQNRDIGQAIGRSGAGRILERKLTWGEHASCLKALVLSLRTPMVGQF